MEKDKDSLFIYMLAAALSALFMGTIGTISAYSGLGAETVTFFRLFGGCLFMTILLIAQKKISLVKIRFSPSLLISGFCLAGFIVMYIQSMKYTSMANAVVTIYLAPLAASAGGHFFFSEKLNRFSFFLICLALAGFLIMKGFDPAAGGDGAKNSLKGMVLAMTAMVFYALYILMNRIIPGEIPVFARTWYQFLFGALVILPFFLIHREAIAPVQAFWLGMAGLFPGFLGILMAVTALDRLPAAAFGTLAYLEPITVMFLGWTLFGQTLTLWQMAGALIIISAGFLRVFIPPVTPRMAEV